MLEKALISGVVHQREETVYRVEGATAATALRRARRGASVNVDTIVQTNAEIVFSAPVEDRARRLAARRASASAGPSRDDLGKVSLVGAGMKATSASLRRRSRPSKTPGSRPRSSPPRRSRSPCHVPLQRRRQGRSALARGVRAWASDPASASSAQPAPSGRSRWSSSRERGYARRRLFASARSAGKQLAGRRSRRRRRRCSLPAISISVSSRRHLGEPRARSTRRPRRGRLCRQVRRLPLEPGILLVVPEVPALRSRAQAG